MSDQSDLEQFLSADSGGERQPAERESEDPDPEEHGTAHFPSLPANWEIKRLDEVATVQGGSTPSTDEDEYWGGNIPWATPTDLTELQGNTISDTEDKITEAGLESTSTHVLPPYSVLLTSRASIGKCAVNTVPMATNQGFQSLIPGEELNTWYLYYVITEMAPYLESLGAGSTFSEISKREVQRVQIPVPPMEEQLRIASVLYNTGDLVETRSELIEHLGRLLTATRRRLFERGIDDGEIKSVETFGTVPAHWDIVPLKEVADVIMGSSPKSEFYNSKGDGLPFFQANSEFGLRTPTHDRWCSNPAKTANEGDILLTVRASVGELNIAPLECCIGRGLAAITPTSVNREFLYHHLEFRARYLQSIATGSTFDSVSTGDIENLPIAVPPTETQKKIANTLESIQQEYIHAHSRRNLTDRIQEGLMRELISGQSRVRDEAIDILDEVRVNG